LRPGFCVTPAVSETLEDSASRRMCRHNTLNRDQAAKAFSTDFGSRLIARSRALAGPVGWRRPCSQLRSVPTSTSRSRANFDWLSPVMARSSFTFSASTKNSREGARSPRRISSCCCMLSTSRRAARARVQFGCANRCGRSAKGVLQYRWFSSERHLKCRGNSAHLNWNLIAASSGCARSAIPPLATIRSRFTSITLIDSSEQQLLMRTECTLRGAGIVLPKGCGDPLIGNRDFAIVGAAVQVFPGIAYRISTLLGAVDRARLGVLPLAWDANLVAAGAFGERR
jgi:hypothetical protein